MWELGGKGREGNTHSLQNIKQLLRLNTNALAALLLVLPPLQHRLVFPLLQASGVDSCGHKARHACIVRLARLVWHGQDREALDCADWDDVVVARLGD